MLKTVRTFRRKAFVYSCGEGWRRARNATALARFVATRYACRRNGIAKASAMKLYDGGRAPNPRRVRIFLAEKGITVATEQVDLGKLQQRSETYSAINPMQRVPALVLDDGTAIAESIAICRYFEAVAPDPPLFGRGAVQSALVEMWNRRIEFHLFFPVASVFQHLHPAMKIMVDPQVAAWGEANKPRIFDFLQFLDGELKDRQHVAGAAYSVADITALVAVDFMRVSKLVVPDTLSNVRRWHAAVSARPSAAA
jgi:glutathione S-transferase